jgi:hypothetical protein
MIKKPKIGALLLSLLGAALWLSPDVAAQATATGRAKGQVKLCSMEKNTEGKIVRKEQPQKLVKVCAFWEDIWKQGLKCPSDCKRPTCKKVETDSDGVFRFSALKGGSWVFIAVKKEFTLRGLFVKSEIEGNNDTTPIEPEEPPPPLWLTPTNCPDLAMNNPGASPVIGGDVVASVTGNHRGSADIVLVLYRDGQQTDTSDATEQKDVILKGKVVDTEFQPIKDAEAFITAFSEDDDIDLSKFPPPTKTNEHGEFRLTLPAKWKAGTYIFSVTREGFRPYITTLDKAVPELREKPTPSAQGGASPPAGNYIILRRNEELSGGTETLVEKFEATRRHVFLPEVMQTLPVQGTRSFDQFALLAPGVLPPPETFGGAGPGVSAGVGTAGQFSINGLRSRENNFTVEGSDNNDEDTGTRRQGFIMTVSQPIESVQELQIITALPDAQFGRNIGGQINALTKSGGAGRFHGLLYGYIADNHLSAPDPFDQTGAPAGFTPRRSSDGAPVLLDGTPLVRRSQTGGEDQFTRVQLGFAVGGQLTRDNDTSYFISGERQDVRADKEAHFAVPTVRQRGAFASGDTGLLLTDGSNARTPLYPASVPGNAVFSLFPFPNNPLGPYGENTYSTVLPADGHGWRFSGKLGREFKGDPPGGKWWKAIFTTKAHVDQFTARYNFTDELSTLPVTGGAIFSSLRPRVQTQNLAGFINRTLSATTTDTIRLSAAGTRFSFGERRDASLLASSALPDTSFLLNAPLLLNVTRPNPDGTLNAPSFVSAAGTSGSELLNTLGYQGVTQTEQLTGPLGQVFIAGFSPLGVDVENFPQTRLNRTFQFADTVTAIRGPNVFTFGVDVRKTRIDSRLERNFRPRAVFNGLPGAPLANVVERPVGGQVQTAPLAGTTLAAAGVPTGLFQTLATPPSSPSIIHFTQANLFVQDQWQVLPNLNLTAGIRYELNTVPDTANRRLETAFDPVELRRLAEEAARLCQPNVRCNDLVPALTAAFPADFKVSFGSDHNDFDARVGFAWAPSRLRNTSVRGGFGTYSGQFPAVVIGQIRNAFPNFLPLNLANFTPRSGNRTFLFNLASPAVQQLLPRPDDVPIGITPGSLNQLQPVNPVAFLVNQIFNLQELSLSPTAFGLNLVLPQPKLKPPYSYHYALTVEHQFRDDYLISAAFVGTRGVQLLRVTTPALGLNDSRFRGAVGVSPLTAGEPFPFFTGQILPPQANLISQSFAIAPTYFNSSSQSTYNSLQLEFRKRYSDGLLVGSALTYSHSIDDASDFFDNAGAFALPQNSVRSSERASSNFDVRLRSATHFVLDLQREWFSKKEWAGTKKEWLARVLGGFQLAGIFTAQGGQPYTVNSALDINRDGNLTDRLNTTDGIIRDPAAGRVQLRLAPGVNTRDLLAPDGLDGSVGRNTFRAPHIYSIDFSVTETIPFRDHTRFVVRAEFFNLFNWANYGIPVRILESPGFGTSISILTPPRTIQFVGKFQF